ncbi:hypothetical protein RI129_009067 [Pyrocoelia pectoralis]|uniref:Ionotropic glutamate receptor C-terminal domain-containing protein n=1 Tax=Pyrocoelia pectoralis TaxID=417401 RepID=A0AAN7V6R6_9COLE
MIAENIKHLTVGIFNGYDFDCKISNGMYSGYTFEVMKLLQEYNISIHYRKINLKTSNVTELLLSKQIDILGCHPDNDFASYLGIVPLIRTLQSNYVLIYDPNKLSFTKDIFILTFAGTLWICFLIVLILLAICLNLSTKQYSYLDLKYEPWSWVDITLWGNAAACQQGLSHTPKGFASRSIFFLGYLISYLLYTGFAAGITSLLLQQGMSKHITAKDIQKMDIKIDGVIIVSNVGDVFVHINRQNVVGIVPKLLVEQYYAKHLNYHSTQIYATSKLTNILFSRSFLMRKDADYKAINNILLKLKQSGVLEKILRESLLVSPINTDVSKYSSAGIEHVGSAIMILVVGTLASTIFLVFELIFALYKGKL